MAIIEAQRLSFTYPDEEEAALNEVTLSAQKGEFVVLCGPSGSGKTTLLRHFKRELTPVGQRGGSIHYDGLPLEDLPDGRAAEEIGFVFQHPESQIVMDTVWHELAFAMENRGFDRVRMRKRLAELANFFGLEPLMQRSVHDLSGGQTQIVNLASVLLLQPRLLLLDEPTSQLDPVAAREFMYLLRRLNDEFGMTIIVSEHRLEDVIPLADRVVLMEAGRIKYDGSPREVCRRIMECGDETDRLFVPSITRLLASLQAEARETALTGGSTASSLPATAETDVNVKTEPSAETLPLTVREAVRALSRLRPLLLHTHNGDRVSSGEAGHRTSPPSSLVLDCREVTYRYGRDLPEVLKRLSLHVEEGEWLAILGGNGAGKSTLLQTLAGLRKPQRGKVRVEGKRTIGYLAQNPMPYFSSDTVAAEFKRAAEQAALKSQEADAATRHWSSLFSLEHLMNRHPHDLSGGQQQKLALALVLLPGPDILCIDEPTKGLDPQSKEKFAKRLHALRSQGITLVMVTHDVEFAARHATRCALLYDGDITAEAPPAAFFGGNYFYTTSVNRVVRDRYPDAVTDEDVKARWASEIMPY